MLQLISPLSHCPTVHTNPQAPTTQTIHLTDIPFHSFSFHSPPIHFQHALQLITQCRCWVLFCTPTLLAWRYSLPVYVIIQSLILRIKTQCHLPGVFLQSVRSLSVLEELETGNRRNPEELNLSFHRWEMCSGSWQNTLGRIIKVTESPWEDFLKMMYRYYFRNYALHWMKKYYESSCIKKAHEIKKTYIQI